GHARLAGGEGDAQLAGLLGQSGEGGLAGGAFAQVQIERFPGVGANFAVETGRDQRLQGIAPRQHGPISLPQDGAHNHENSSRGQGAGARDWSSAGFGVVVPRRALSRARARVKRALTVAVETSSRWAMSR